MSVIPSRADRSSTAWQRAGVAVILGLLALVTVYWPTAVSLVRSWAKDPLGHGYLVVPAVLYLVWTRRHVLRGITPAPTLWPLPIALALAFGWLLGRLTSTDVVQHTALIGLAVAVVWTVVGTAALRALAFPLGFLVFALPIADRFVPWLQDVAARFAVTLLTASGVPVLLQGHEISIPGATWQVAEACSGINYLMSSLAIGYIYAGLTYSTWRNRILFMLAAALIPLAGNGIRVYGTILLASHGVPGIIEGTQHYLFGWVVFALMMAALLLTCGSWQDAAPLPPAGQHSAPRPAIQVRAVGLALTLTILAGGVAPLAAQRYVRYSSQYSAPSPVSPSVRSPWQSATDDPYRWQPRFTGQVDEFVRTYRFAGRAVRLHVASYSAAEASTNLVSTANRLSERPWVATSTRSIRRPVDGLPSVRETALGSDGTELRVWSWYSVGGAATASDYAAKLLLAREQLLRRPFSASYVIIATIERADVGRSAAATLADFVGHLRLQTPDAGTHHGRTTVALATTLPRLPRAFGAQVSHEPWTIR